MKKCTACGSKKIKRQTKAASFKYKGKKLVYDQPGIWCLDCGEVFLEKSDKEIADNLIYAFQAKIDERLLT